MNNCYSCGCELQEDEGITSEITGEIYCEDCYWDEFTHCENCDSECYNSEIYCDDGQYLCESCHEEYMNEHEEEDEELPNIIGNYHVRDLPIEFKYLESEIVDGITKDDLLYFGTEQECYNDKHIISNNEMANKIRNKYPHFGFVFEKDSTIGGNGDGFEMISQPMTLPYVKEHKDELKDINDMLIEYGFTSHNARSCGLHIHFSRNFFADNEDKYIQKLTLFFETYKDELKAFSRRKEFNWCAWISDSSSIDKRYLKSSVILKDYAKNHASHGIAINLGNTNTIEIRIFRGTLKFETYMASLELVNSLVRTIKTKETRKINFDNVVNMAGNEYVQEYCESKNIYNSQYMNDETKNVFKELESKKAKMEIIKEECKTEIETTLKDMAKISKETEINFDAEDIRTTFNILSQINSILSSRIRDLKNEIFNKNDKKIEECYQQYISISSYNNPISYYKNLVDDISYIVNSQDNDLMNKLRDLYNTAREKLNKLNDLMNNNTTLQGEE